MRWTISWALRQIPFSLSLRAFSTQPAIFNTKVTEAFELSTQIPKRLLAIKKEGPGTMVSFSFQ